ncbi:hypothetical protein LOK49_LG14G01666 [Camellia lanceoleosa]|uniref:Uncharacterized protein n=1 Tax=Camellia lanceoleosa TaxID=1840588 RepID=A0ACC0FAF0_9ERIC|nr:hypothetical protein LOK49_LG14G01666 [Camellia lanceoleosa]
MAKAALKPADAMPRPRQQMPCQGRGSLKPAKMPCHGQGLASQRCHAKAPPEDAMPRQRQMPKPEDAMPWLRPVPVVAYLKRRNSVRIVRLCSSRHLVALGEPQSISRLRLSSLPCRLHRPLGAYARVSDSSLRRVHASSTKASPALAAAAGYGRYRLDRGRLAGRSYAVPGRERRNATVDPAKSHMLVSKIKPCMCKYELIQTVKLRMAH